MDRAHDALECDDFTIYGECNCNAGRHVGDCSSLPHRLKMLWLSLGTGLLSSFILFSYIKGTEHMMKHYRWVFVCVGLLPISLVYSAILYIRNAIVFKFKSAPQNHARKVQEVSQQVGCMYISAKVHRWRGGQGEGGREKRGATDDRCKHSGFLSLLSNKYEMWGSHTVL